MTASDVANGSYKYTNMERALYFAHEEILKTSGEIYYLRGERTVEVPTMAEMLDDFDVWLQMRSKVMEMSSDNILDTLRNEVLRDKYCYGK